MRRSTAMYALLALVTAGASAQVADPGRWPTVKSPTRDVALERRIDSILQRMSLEQKVGQIIQADIGSVTPEDVATYHLGSVLNGGSSSPNGDEFGPPSGWLALADAFYAASMRPQGDLPRIPVMWGSDAVHGHNNIVGATLFPHNIGLGAARDPELIRRIGEATAAELRATGLDWTFAPTIAVARDDRWGRTYESFGEDPALVASYATAQIQGLQGRRGATDWLKGRHVIATAKHFIADGGTDGGRDRGDAEAGEAELIRVHAPPYVAALDAGAASVMASFSSWRGAKMHDNASLLTGVLKERWKFDGLVVGDWDGHARVTGCTPTDCPQTFVAGLDMAMAPASWRGLYASTLAAAKSGKLPMARLDDAVRRVLRVKLRAGLFEAGAPSTRPLAGRYDLIGSPAHRAIAREAVAKSMVLLKNTGVLPLKAGARVLVAGDGADGVAKQSGGWTLSWQGTGTRPEHFPGATSIGRAILSAAGGRGEISADGRYSAKPDVAVVVFGEDPYAEFQGDRPDLYFDDAHDTLALLRRLKADGIPTVAVFLSGRPLWVNPQLNAADAFVAAWLPGSEGGGVADVLFGRRPFTGKLSFSWPADAKGAPLNIGDANYRPLFPYGYGLGTADRRRWTPLSEQPGVATAAPAAGPLFARGRATAPATLRIDAANDSPRAVAGAADNGAIRVQPVDRDAQEDALQLSWSGSARGTFAITSPRPGALGTGLKLRLALRVDAPPAAPVTIDAAGGRLDVTRALAGRAGHGWTTLDVPLSCLSGADLSRVTRPFALTTTAKLTLTLSSVSLLPSEGAPCP